MITVLSALIRPCKQVESHMKFNVRNIIMCPLFLDSSPISRLQRVMLGKSTALRHVSPLTVDESWQRVAVSCLTGYFSKSVTGLSHTRRQLVTLCIFFRYDMRNLFYFLLDTYNNPPPKKEKKISFMGWYRKYLTFRIPSSADWDWDPSESTKMANFHMRTSYYTSIFYERQENIRCNRLCNT